MSSNFNFYVNRQGVQGVRGAKGEQGFSPVITVKTETASEYVLQVENEDGTFDTPNLRGNAIENSGGTYIRFNPETEEMYTGEADSATTDNSGVVRFSTYAELEAGDVEDAVPSAMDVHEFVENSIGAITGFVTTSDFNTYTTATDATLLSLSTNKLNKSTYDAYVLETGNTLSSLSTNKLDVSTFNTYTGTTDAAIGALDTNKLDFTDLTNTLVQGSNVTLTADVLNKTITISATSYTEGDGIDITNGAISVKVDGTTIDLNADGELEAIGGGGGTTYTEGNGIDITNDAISVKVDSTTIDFNASGELEVIGGGTQVQADWDESDPSDPSYIQNKPTIPATLSEGSGISINNSVISAKVDSTTIDFDNSGNLTTVNMVKSLDIENIVSCTQVEYDALVSGGTLDANTLYVISTAS